MQTAITIITTTPTVRMTVVSMARIVRVMLEPRITTNVCRGGHASSNCVVSLRQGVWSVLLGRVEVVPTEDMIVCIVGLISSAVTCSAFREGVESAFNDEMELVSWVGTGLGWVWSAVVVSSCS